MERERHTHTHTHIHTHTGQALASYPGVKQLFDALGGISLTRGEVQTHVDTASAAVKDIVKKSPTNARGDPASLSSSVMLMCLKAAAVGCTAYVCYDARARKAALDALDRMRGWGQVHVKSCLNKSKAMLGDANLSEAVTNVHASLDKKRQHFKRHLDDVRVTCVCMCACVCVCVFLCVGVWVCGCVSLCVCVCYLYVCF